MNARLKSIARISILYIVAFGLMVLTLFVLKIDKPWALFAGFGLLLVGIAILVVVIMEAQKLRRSRPKK